MGWMRRAYVFVMVLCYSRHMVARIVFDQKLETWLRLHVEVFLELGMVSSVPTSTPNWSVGGWGTRHGC